MIEKVDVARANARSHGEYPWESDRVVTSGGVVLPVRATARRPEWEDLGVSVRSLIQETVEQPVVDTWSARTGFTPGFASRLTLADGVRVFVKAASSDDDKLHGWPLSDAYRDEVRKLAALPTGIGAPRLLWHRDVEIEDARWVVLGLQYVDGAPPRRPWRHTELRLVMAKLAATAAALSRVPAGLQLARAVSELTDGQAFRLARLRERGSDDAWSDRVERLCDEADERLDGASVVHLDLRDDNILIDAQDEVWFVDWNWPAVGAPWIDLVCILISAVGDGIDGDSLLADHPLTAAVDPVSIDCLLAVLWTFWEVQRHEAAPAFSPHLRNHQAWYADATAAWLTQRLASRGPECGS
jgi:hypothetical protein